MKHFYVFCLNVFIVLGGQSVVDKTTVVEGQTFTITCDYLHVNGIVPNCSVAFLEVFKNFSNGIPQIIITLDNGKYNNMNIPSHWTKDCTNPKNSYDVTQFRCKLIVNDARISDSGHYGCSIALFCTDGQSTRFEGHSDVVVAKENTTKSEASINFGEGITTGLCLMMITAAEL
ncbi:unnamed protein product [Lymnaea stagnalis]|uniref:Immunoglobulin subtype domain-containing protein n=1 Tax=Lymnaea stagnalis TaxID=6523 RepID=A0AAV2HHW2_LYMST